MPPLASIAARVLAALALALVVAAAGQATGNAEPPAPFIPGEVIVTLEPGAVSAASVPGASVKEGSFDHKDVTVAVPPGQEMEYIRTLDSEDGVVRAELNYLRQPSYAPNDSAYPLQWGFHMIEAEQAWDYARGEGVTVAILDTGIAFELYGQFARSPQLSRTLFVSPYDATTGGNHPNDDNGHGTHVAGTIAQDSDDGTGAAGLAPAAAIMPVKVCRPQGCGADDLAEGVRWAVDHGADVINISLGGGGITMVEREALDYAETHGVVVVAAAGNGGADFIGDDRIDFPAAAETVISVGAVDTQTALTRYSNFGRGEGDHLHVVAPGGNTRVDQNNDGHVDGIIQNTYAHTCGASVVDYTVFTDCFYHGTSMATPHVAGLAALILSEYPGLTPARVRMAIACGALDLGPAGVDDTFGVGLVRAGRIFRDTDGDRIPNCAETPPPLDIFADHVTVTPGAEFTVGVYGYAPEGIGDYVAHLAYNSNVLEFIRCDAREGAVCVTTPSQVHFEADGGDGLESSFGFGYVTFRAVGPPGSSSLLVAAGEADAPSPSDPRAAVTSHHGSVAIREVPATVAGDVDCDGSVTISDVPATLALITETVSTICVDYADVNCSGAADAADALALLEFLASIEPSVPTGCPRIGQSLPD
jgi:serine protease